MINDESPKGTPSGPRHVFVLRAWHNGIAWRWSILTNDEPERLGFADLDSVYLYLASLTTETETPTSDHPDESHQ